MFRKIGKRITSSIVEELLMNQRIEWLNYCALNIDKKGVIDEWYGDKEIIVSLTTYGKRFSQVYLTIESLMQQTVKANRIVLWLDDSFKNTFLYPVLKKQMGRGLEIYFYKNIYPYKKLIPTLQMFPEAVIITVDDDAFYDANLLQNLISAYIFDPQYIYFNLGHRMKLNSSGDLLNYNNWDMRVTSLEVSILNFPTGVGGVLYPPHSLHPEVLNEDEFMRICSGNDDIWFKAMALLNGVQCKKVESVNNTGFDFIINSKVQDVALYIRNCIQGDNDAYINAVFSKYDIYSLLKKK